MILFLVQSEPTMNGWSTASPPPTTWLTSLGHNPISSLSHTPRSRPRPIVSMATSYPVMTTSSDDEDLTQSVFTRAVKPVVKQVSVAVTEEDGYLSPDDPCEVVKAPSPPGSPATTMSKVVAARERLLRLQQQQDRLLRLQQASRGPNLLCERKSTGQYNKDLQLLQTYGSQKEAAQAIGMSPDNMSRRIKKWSKHQGPWTTEEFEDIYPYRLEDGTKVIYRTIPAEHMTSASMAPPQPQPKSKTVKKPKKKRPKAPVEKCKSDDEPFEEPATQQFDRELDDGEVTPRALSDRKTRPPPAYLPGTPDEFSTKRRRRLANKGKLYYEPTAQTENTCHGHTKRLKDHLTLVHVECKCKTIDDKWKGRAHCLHCLIEYQVKGELDCLRCFHCRAPVKKMHVSMTEDQSAELE